jgi:glycosyltransferase involved in cell wall biosynthesis
LVFAAQGGRTNQFKDYPTLQAALERLERPVDVTVLGDPPVPAVEVARRLRTADLYVHASHADTFPSGVLEALACGTPVVASRLGGIPEQVTGETGVLVEPGNPAALATAIDELLADPARRARLGAAATADARQRFSLERQIDAYIDLYERLPRVGGG